MNSGRLDAQSRKPEGVLLDPQIAGAGEVHGIDAGGDVDDAAPAVVQHVGSTVREIRFDATGRRTMDKGATRKRELPPYPWPQQQQKRSIDLVHKPVNSVCYRQVGELLMRRNERQA